MGQMRKSDGIDGWSSAIPSIMNRAGSVGFIDANLRDSLLSGER